MEGLTDKQKRFVAEYLIDCNHTKAAERAGYSKKMTRGSAGVRLMKDPKILAAIKATQKLLGDRLQITAEKVLKENARIAFSDIREAFHPDSFELIPPTKLPDDVAAVVSGVKKKQVTSPSGDVYTTWEYEFYDKGKALDKLFRHLGLYNDKTIVDASDDLKALLKEIDGRGIPRPKIT